MLVTYFRSSSFTTWDFCPFKYFLDYTLGFRSPANKAAEKGSICHKALELLARKKLATQQTKPTFRDEEIGRGFTTLSMTPEEAVEIAWHYYTEEKDSLYEWKPADRKEILRWTNQVLEYNDGQFSPLKRTVVAPETYFDFTFDEPWAKYKFTLPDGNEIEGQLAMKGTVDLIVESDEPGYLEMIDWKTGKWRTDWATGEEKTWQKLRDDPQLRMYHYAALKHLYPQAKGMSVTIYWIQAGGPFSLPFGKADLAKTEKMIRERFEVVKQTTQPKRNRTWKCGKFCHFGTNYDEKSGCTICDHMHRELVTLGLEKVMVKHAKPGAFDSYGDGGGRSGDKTGR